MNVMESEAPKDTKGQTCNWHRCSTCMHRDKMMGDTPCKTCGKEHKYYEAWQKQ